jgi:hypothetical protein
MPASSSRHTALYRLSAAPARAQVPHVSRQDYSLLDISDDGFVRALHRTTKAPPWW